MPVIEASEVAIPTHVWTRVTGTFLEVWHGTGIARNVTVRSDGSMSLMGSVGWEVRPAIAVFTP